MKIESMRTRSYRSFKVDDADLPAEARERLSAIRRHDELRAAGCAEQAALRETGVSRRTMYRWKAPPDAGFPLGERRQSLVRMVPQASAPVREYADGRSKPRAWRHGSKLILCAINEAWCAAWLTRLDARPPATCRNCARDRLFQRLRPGIARPSGMGSRVGWSACVAIAAAVDDGWILAPERYDPRRRRAENVGPCVGDFPVGAVDGDPLPSAAAP